VTHFQAVAVVGMIVASIARPASAQDGPGTVADAPRPVSAAAAASPVPVVPVTEAIRLDGAIRAASLRRKPRAPGDC
jgi:hypothetical protein